MNTKFLKQIAATILEHPKQFRMESFFSTINSMEQRPDRCGTACCIAGWAIALAENLKPNEAWDSVCETEGEAEAHDIAKELLGLTENQADRLFYHEEWPHEFRDRYNCARSTTQKATVAAKRLARFIKTEGRE